MTFPIVAIGASAGGLEPLSELVAALPCPPHSDMAFIVVMHLDPDHESLLSEILGKKTSLPVSQAQDGAKVEPGHVYVIPPNATLMIAGECLKLAPRTSSLERRMPADILFRSLAEERADRAIGVILSGGDSDGALGIQAIKHRGGITFAQEPASARFPSMPRSAIETGCVDFVRRPVQIAREIARLGHHPYLRAVPSPALKEAENGSEEVEEVGPVATRLEEESLRRVFRRLRGTHGVDFSHYKRSTLQRRLARRMALHSSDNPEDYLALLEGDPAEAAALYQDFLIRVTGFFRDPEAFDALLQRVFPVICEGRSPKDPIRIWVPGCASGEEVYSIAIALVEYLGEKLGSVGVQIFGTDVSEAAIEKARAGIYLNNIAQQVSNERLERFFVKHDHYRIAKGIRDLCVFALQDVTRDPPFSRLDLVSCRNLLIYLDTAAQRRVMQVFHYALRPRGFLMLGPSESIGPTTDFDLIDAAHRVYTRRPSAGPGDKLPTGDRTPAGRAAGAADNDPSISAPQDTVRLEADRLLLSRYAPASLLIDDALNILQFRGETGPFLEHASGAPSLNLQRVARPELLVEMAPAIQQARETGLPVRREGLCLDAMRNLTLEVIPLKQAGSGLCYVILLDDESRTPPVRRAQQQTLIPVPESEKDRRLVQLQRELAAIRDYLQVTMEKHEAVKDELKITHEEVLSANEEFQSTNEELETAKEELQSANEELITTNEELRHRVRELSQATAEVREARDASERARRYADSIVETVREPLMVLDSDLKILRANQAFYVDFNTVRDETEGRYLYEIGNGQWDIPALRAGLGKVLAGEQIDDLDVTHTFPSIGERAMRLSARRIPGNDERVELILLAIEDVTQRRAVADALAQDVQRKDEFLAMLAHELRNPLTPITHAVRLLQSGNAGSSAPRLHDMIERQAGRMVRLVDELLDVARIGRGLIELKREPVDIGELMQHAAAAARPRIEERGQVLSLSSPDTAVWVNGDPLRLEQVLSNLLDNATKYTDAGGRIIMTLSRQDDEAVLAVRDDGVGIAKVSLEHIFELFTQVDRSLARSGGGLGIGLTLVRRVLELHGGSIEARSAGLGQGSEFVVHLPVLAVSNATRAPVKAEEKSLSAPGSTARRVLIVDDNADSAESMALLARSWGHEVEVAADGSGALALANGFRPDIALVDIGLPGMDGYEVARRLRAEPGHGDLQLIALTGYGREEDRNAARDAGFDVHLVKPPGLRALEELLARDPQKRTARTPPRGA